MINKLIVMVLAFIASAAIADQPETMELGGVKTPMVGEVDRFFSIPPTKYLVINSPGGYVTTAFAAVHHLRNMTCVVSYAASAAWQILLPACKERYYLPWAVTAFHSTHVDMYGPMNMWDTTDLAVALQETNIKMTNHMLSSGFPMGPKEFFKHLKEETVSRGKELDRFYPWIKPVSECNHCPLSWKRIKRHHKPQAN